MSNAILNATTELIEPGRYRVHAEPKFFLNNGAWASIDDHLAVARVGGVYRVSLLDDWITFTPRVRRAGQLRRAVLGLRRFGDIIDAALKPDVAQYDVAFSAGVEPCVDGWQFSRAGGTPIGLFLNDWRDRFGAGKVVLTSQSAEVDLTEAVPDANDQINLDPTTVNVAAYGYGWRQNFDWGIARNSTSGSFSSLDLPVLTDKPSIQFRFYRGLLRFDTSGIAGTVTLAELYLTRNLYDDDPADVLVSLCDFGAALDGTDYAAVKTGYESNPIGVMERVSGNLWKRDITAAFAKDSTFDLGLAEYGHDVLNVPIAGGTRYGTDFVYSGAGAPYLQVTTASPAPAFFVQQQGP